MRDTTNGNTERDVPEVGKESIFAGFSHLAAQFDSNVNSLIEAFTGKSGNIVLHDEQQQQRQQQQKHHQQQHLGNNDNANFESDDPVYRVLQASKQVPGTAPTPQEEARLRAYCDRLLAQDSSILRSNSGSLRSLRSTILSGNDYNNGDPSSPASNSPRRAVMLEHDLSSSDSLRFDSSLEGCRSPRSLKRHVVFSESGEDHSFRADEFLAEVRSEGDNEGDACLQRLFSPGNEDIREDTLFLDDSGSFNVKAPAEPDEPLSSQDLLLIGTISDERRTSSRSFTASASSRQVSDVSSRQISDESTTINHVAIHVGEDEISIQWTKLSNSSHSSVSSASESADRAVDTIAKTAQDCKPRTSRQSEDSPRQSSQVSVTLNRSAQTTELNSHPTCARGGRADVSSSIVTDALREHKRKQQDMHVQRPYSTSTDSESFLEETSDTTHSRSDSISMSSSLSGSLSSSSGGVSDLDSHIGFLDQKQLGFETEGYTPQVETPTTAATSHFNAWSFASWSTSSQTRRQQQQACYDDQLEPKDVVCTKIVQELEGELHSNSPGGVTSKDRSCAMSASAQSNVGNQGDLTNKEPFKADQTTEQSSFLSSRFLALKHIESHCEQDPCHCATESSWSIRSRKQQSLVSSVLKKVETYDANTIADKTKTQLCRAQESLSRQLIANEEEKRTAIDECNEQARNPKKLYRQLSPSEQSLITLFSSSSSSSSTNKSGGAQILDLSAKNSASFGTRSSNYDNVKMPPRNSTAEKPTFKTDLVKRHGSSIAQQNSKPSEKSVILKDATFRLESHTDDSMSSTEPHDNTMSIGRCLSNDNSNSKAEQNARGEFQGTMTIPQSDEGTRPIPESDETEIGKCHQVEIYIVEDQRDLELRASFHSGFASDLAASMSSKCSEDHDAVSIATNGQTPCDVDILGQDGTVGESDDQVDIDIGLNEQVPKPSFIHQFLAVFGLFRRRRRQSYTTDLSEPLLPIVRNGLALDTNSSESEAADLLSLEQGQVSHTAGTVSLDQQQPNFCTRLIQKCPKVLFFGGLFSITFFVFAVFTAGVLFELF